MFKVYGGTKMANRDGKELKNKTFLFSTSGDALRGKQSIRATFKLSERAIGAISAVAAHLGIKQKSLFDHLIDDMNSLRTIAENIQEDEFKELRRVQKTFVLSRRSITCLEEVSRFSNTPRDALVEYSIKKLIPVIKEERERHRKRKLLFEDMKTFLSQGDNLLDKIRSEVGENDPLYEEFENANKVLGKAYETIKKYIEKGGKMENL